MLIYFRRVILLIVGNWGESEASVRAHRGVLLLCLLAAVSCSQPAPYDRVIIDTYLGVGVSPADTYLRLFDTVGNLLEEADDGNPTQADFARIDIGDLYPGTYYIQVAGHLPASNGIYAIRVLLAPDEVYDSDWTFTLLNLADFPYEPDDDSSGNVPSNPIPIAIDGKLNRYLTAGDVDWFTLTLP